MNKKKFSSEELKKISDAPKVKRNFHIGDLVRLNSGSPIMTVVDFDETHVVASWREGKYTFEEIYPKVTVSPHWMIFD